MCVHVGMYVYMHVCILVVHCRRLLGTSVRVCVCMYMCIHTREMHAVVVLLDAGRLVCFDIYII